MKFTRCLSLLVILVCVLTACAPPSTYLINLAYTPGLKENTTVSPGDVHIAVIPFEDVRAEKEIIGTRRGLFGKTDKFAPQPAPVTSAVTQALITALKIRGYQTKVLQSGTAVEDIKESPPHIVISGKIEELMADARSRTGYTDIKANVRLRVKFYKVDEKRSYTIVEQSQSEMRDPIFTPAALQNAINGALTEAINRMIHANL